MKIYLITEGYYPYVAGGVSPWIQVLIKEMPRRRFIIYTIGANMSQRGQFKYDIPENMISVGENFLGQFLDVKIQKNRNYRLLPREHQVVLDLISRDIMDWNRLFDTFSEDGKYQTNEFLYSHAFMSIVMAAYEDAYRIAPFTQVSWTIHSMLLPVLNILSCPIPDVDVFHSVSTGYAGLLGAMFQYKTREPYIITEHGVYTRKREEEILKASWVDVYSKQTWVNFFMRVSRAAYDKADQIISLSYRARQLQTEFGVEDSKCMMIPDGINMGRFEHTEPVKEDHHPLAPGAVIRVVPIKDTKAMIYVFDIVRCKVPGGKLYLIRPADKDKEYHQECLDSVASLGCTRIEFVGRVDVAQWYRCMGMIPLDSVSEGQPFVLLEAMAAGRPTIATDVSSCRELIEGNLDIFGSTGLVVPVINPDQVARAISKLWQDTGLRKRMVRVDRERVSAYYREEDFLSAYEKLHQGVNVIGRSRV